MKPALAPDEAARLELLRELQVLDTPAEPEFDEITALAAQICGVPISVVSLIDTDRQWFKARVGVDDVQTSREESFCAHAILERGMTVVPDALLDDRFADNPQVAQTDGLRFYAGAPLVLDGVALGTLCVADRRPRELTGEQRQALQTLARHATTQLQLRRYARQAAEQAQHSEGLQQQAQQQAALLSAVMEGISDGVAVVNERGEFLLHNPAAKAILGVGVDADSVDEWQAHYGVYRPDGVTPFPADEMPLARALAGESHDNVQMVIRNATHPDGVRINVSARPLSQTGVQARAVAVFHDVTAAYADRERIRASEEQLRLLLDGAHDHSIILLDPDGRVASWSANAQRIKGYTEQEILGRHYSAFFPEDAAAAGEPQQNLTEAARLGRVETEGPRVRKDGSRFWSHSVLTALADDSGSVRGFVKVTQDVTARRQAEQRFRDLLEAAPDATIGCAADGRIVLVNGRAEQLFGYRRSELLGRPVETLVPESLRGGHAGNREAYLADPVSRPMGAGRPLTAQRSDGTLFPAEISLSTLHTDEGPIVSAAVRDISDRVRVQQELAQVNQQLHDLNQDLERRVHDRTAALEEQTTALQQANGELEAFSYSVSHDLRAPLRAVDGFAKMLALNYGEQLDDEARRYVDRIRGGAQRMGQLIDGLLSFSRLQRQELARQQVPVAPMVTDVWEELAGERAGREVELVVGDLPAADADPRLLRHVIANLVGNAVKYSRGQDKARVEVSACTGEDGETVYCVRDNGVGFDMRYADKLFKVFQRLHRAEDYEGTGIGLALVQRIVHRHGGRIWAQAQPGEGASFLFTLPTKETSS